MRRYYELLEEMEEEVSSVLPLVYCDLKLNVIFINTNNKDK